MDFGASFGCNRQASAETFIFLLSRLPACARCSCNIILFIYLYYVLADVYQDVLVGSVRVCACAYFLFFTMDTAWASVRGASARRRCLFHVRMRIYYFLILLFIYMPKRKAEFSEGS